MNAWTAGVAGHYVPNLALAVVKFNEVADASDRINIKGFMAGRASCCSVYPTLAA